MSVRTRNLSPPSGAVHGVLLIDKPPKMTSHDVVSHVRRAFGTRRVGHAGTLDPMATGVLVVLLGEATKLSSVLTTKRKTYETRVEFGKSTDSLDADGKITKKVQLTPGWLTPEALEHALDQERIRRLQVPPQVSAIKVDGQRAYARARQGKTTELAPRDVVVHHLELERREDNAIVLCLTVSKGYYVRSLARDLGSTLGVPAHLTDLRRVASGPFTVDRAVPLPLSGKEPLFSLAEIARKALPSMDVTQLGAERLMQGKAIDPSHLVAEAPAPPQAALYAAFWEKTLVALVKPCDHGEFRVQRGVNDPGSGHSPLPGDPSGG